MQGSCREGIKLPGIIVRPGVCMQRNGKTQVMHADMYTIRMQMNSVQANPHPC